MTDAITAEQFHAAEGVEDWQVLRRWACARFLTGSFATGKQLVDAISDLAEAANHHPDVDLRYGTVDVRITSHDVGGLSGRDVALAREISAAASDLGVEAHSGAIMLAKVTIDAMDVPDEYASAGWVVADPEGNEAYIATWQGRG